jgi:hypothetical protein
MKKIKTIFKLAGLCTVAVLFTAGLLAGCFSDVDASGAGIPPGKGVVQLNIGGSGEHTAFPAMTGITYVITCTMEGAEQTVTGSRNTHTIELAPGTWTINVEAKNSGNEKVAEGTVEVLVKAGRATGASVLLNAVEPAGAETGTFAWSAIFPNGLDSAVLKYGTEPSESLDINVNTTNGNVTVAGTKRSGELALKPGVYLITVNLAKGTKKAGDVAAVYIYSGLKTTTDWIFTADSLVEFNPLALSVDINASSGITVNSAVLTLSGDGGMVDQTLDFAEDTGNTWKFTTSIPETAVNLSWTLAITTARGTLPDIAGSDAAAANVTLDAVDIYTLTADVGENGTLSVNGGKYEGPLEFLGGTSVTLTATGDTGFELDTMTVNSATQDSPHTFAIDADTTVAVEFDEKTGVDPNLIFEWKKNTDTVSSNLSANFGNAFPVTGYSEITIKNAGTSAIAPDGGGFRIGGENNSGVRTLSIGQTNNALSLATDSATEGNGVFDFSTKKVQISITYENAVQYGTRQILRVSVNNNNTAAASSALLPNGANQIVAYASLATLNTAAGESADATSGTVTLTFPTSTAITQGADTLKKAYVAITAQHDGVAGGTGNWITISGVKIEYLP